jgi:pyruvate dehydrogenase E2 component (dihydrolipoamide acetyltransferase)
VLVKAGDTVAKDQGVVTLESDKATMEVPSDVAGVVREVKVKLDDKVSEGTVIALVEVSDAAPSPSPSGAAGGDSASSPLRGEGKAASAPDESKASTEPATDASRNKPDADSTPTPRPSGGRVVEPAEAFDHDHAAARERATRSVAEAARNPAELPYASPAIRVFARELGVDLAQVTGSGRKGRIQREDVQNFVKNALAGGVPRAAGGGLDLLPWPKVDFAKFGEIETRALSKIKKISGANLARNWAMIPHVTQHDDADITELEALRVALNKENERAAAKGGNAVKLTLLAFLVKAVVSALKKFPDFNASLDATGENLVLKKYFHIGFAADTPNGLVVPVIRDADAKGVLEIAAETGELAKKARDGKLGPAEMAGGCFSISSLGGIGGTAFTPIVNAPEVAILGVSKSATRPVWDGKAFQPRLIVPLSLSYDHRVIDGASAARFTAYLAQVLADMRRVLL